MIGTTQCSAMRGGANLLNDENQEFCKTFEHVLK